MESTARQTHPPWVLSTRSLHPVSADQQGFARPAHIAGSDHHNGTNQLVQSGFTTLIGSQQASFQRECNVIVCSHLAKDQIPTFIISRRDACQAWCCYACKSLFCNMDYSIDARIRPLFWSPKLGSKDYAIVTCALSRNMVNVASTPALGLTCLLRTHPFSRVFPGLSVSSLHYRHRNPYIGPQGHRWLKHISNMDHVPQRRSARTASKPLTTSSALDITLGIEHEFMILQSYEIGQRPMHVGKEKIDYGKSLVSHALQKPAHFECSSCGQKHDFTPPLSVQDKPNENSDHGCWNVVADYSMELSPRQNALLRANDCDVYPVELTSRVLSTDRTKQTSNSTTDTKHEHTINYQEEISSFLKSMNETIDSQGSAIGHRQKRRMVVNNTCALHVHIGNGTAGFPLQTVKNLLSICTASERVIDGMHATSRIGGSALALLPLNEFSEVDANGTHLAADGALFPGTFNKALTERLFCSTYLTRRNEVHTPELKAGREGYPTTQMEHDPSLKQAASGFHTMAFVEVIQQAPNIQCLQELLSLCCETSVNILHLNTKPDQDVSESRPYKRLNTIEFRQHAAITDPQDALHWIDFVQTLVRYSHSQSAESMRSTCARIASDPHFDLPAMFEVLDVGQQTRDFYNHHKETAQSAIDNEHIQAEQLDHDDPLRATMLQLISERADDHNPVNVSTAIGTKFKEGGYGQFSREFIDVYAPTLSEEDKERLTIGWEAPPWPVMNDPGQDQDRDQYDDKE